MKKYFFLAGLLLGFAKASAQSRLGVIASPSLSFSRIYAEPPNIGFSSAGPAVRFNLGFLYDYLIQDNYYFNTGLSYAIQHVSVKKEGLQPSIQEAHILYYLQVPLSLKLYTSEMALDTRLYVMLGVIGQLRINERNVELQNNQARSFVEEFRRWGCAGLVGVGVEYDISLATSVFGGIGYQRGFSNVISQHAQRLANYTVNGYGDRVGIDLGIRF